MGRGGIYFRQTLPNSDTPRIPAQVPVEQSSRIELHEIESGSVSQMEHVFGADKVVVQTFRFKARELF